MSSLEGLLIRIQSKIESRTRRPWFDLQRGYYYKSNTGIKNTNDLRAALEHFHVLLSDNDYDQLFHAFQRSDGHFDFRSFASRLYPKESAVKLIKDGRLVESLQYNNNNNNNNNNNAPQGNNNSSINQGGVMYGPPPGATIYDETTGKYSIVGGGVSSSALTNAGGNIIGSDIDYPVLGETLGNNGTTSYYRYEGPSSTNNNQTVNKSTTGGSRIKKSSTNNNNFRPRITYNRPQHQRYAETLFDDFASHEPVPQSYPEEEFKCHATYSSSLQKPRFDRKELPTFVDVARRHNISRQYNRRPIINGQKR